MPQGAEAHPKYSWDSQHSVGWVGTMGWHLCQHSINTCSPKSATLSSGLTLVSQKRLSGVQGCPQEAPSLKHPGYIVLSRQRPLTVGVPVEESGSWEMGSWREVGPPFQEPQEPGGVEPGRVLSWGTPGVEKGDLDLEELLSKSGFPFSEHCALSDFTYSAQWAGRRCTFLFDR